MLAQHYFQPGWIVYRSTADTKDSAGGLVRNYSSQSSISGRLRPLHGDARSALRFAGSKETEFASHRFYCSPTSDVLPGDRLGKGSVLLDVGFVSNVMSMDRLLQVDCKLAKP